VSRRPPSFRDGTSWVEPGLFLDQLNSVLQTLSARSADIIRLRFGLLDEEPRTLAEIGQIYGISRERVRKIEEKAMSALRHPSRSQVLRGYLDSDDEGSLVSAMRHARRTRIPDDLRDGPSPVFCSRHGWFHPRGLKKCSFCPCELPYHAGVGRPNIYCTKACRQAAYRKRHQATTSANDQPSPPR
jgi:DNA-binding CsgD family transcriptional regulator